MCVWNTYHAPTMTVAEASVKRLKLDGHAV